MRQGTMAFQGFGVKVTKWLPAFALVAGLFVSPAAALTIVRDFIGGTRSPYDVGTGNLTNIFNTAADIWEMTILDAHVLTLHYGWAPVGGGDHKLNAQGGTPNRETEGTILFNNDSNATHTHFYLDPTPWESSEYSTWNETNLNLRAGPVNVARFYNGPSGDAASLTNVDLLMAALHEIGHALGLSLSNLSFIAECSDYEVDIVAPLPYAGSTIPLQVNSLGVTPHLELPAYGAIMAGTNQRERRFPSAADILTIAQVSGFRNLNLELAPRLMMRLAGSSVVISWREIRPGYVLYQNSDLTKTNGWVPVNQTVTTTNGVKSVTIPLTGSALYFELKKP